MDSDSAMDWKPRRVLLEVIATGVGILVESDSWVREQMHSIGELGLSELQGELPETNIRISQVATQALGSPASRLDARATQDDDEHPACKELCNTPVPRHLLQGEPIVCLPKHVAWIGDNNSTGIPALPFSGLLLLISLCRS